MNYEILFNNFIINFFLLYLRKISTFNTPNLSNHLHGQQLMMCLSLKKALQSEKNKQKKTQEHTSTHLTQINVNHSYFVFPRHSPLGRITTRRSFMDLPRESERERESVRERFPQWQITCTFSTVRSRLLAFSDPQTLPSFLLRVTGRPVPLCTLL